VASELCHIYIHPMFTCLPIIIYLSSILIFITSITFIISNNIFIIEWELISIISTTIKINLILIWDSILYSSVIILISANVLKFSKTYIINDPNKLRFTQIVLIFIMSIILLIYIPNIACLLIGWDGLGLTSFILIIYYNNQRSLRARILTILVNRLGDTFILISIITTFNTGDWTIFEIKTNNKLNTAQLIGIIIAAITKRAQIPYSRWLPAAIAAPTPVSALVHSSTLVTAGVFLIYRFSNIIILSSIIQTTLTVSGLITMLIARIRAIYENDIKKIIALSTLRQLGLIIICLGLCLPCLAFIHILTHAIFKALLFIAAGTLISLNIHNQDLRTYGHYLIIAPASSYSIFISILALRRAPFMSGYYSKHAIIRWSNSISTNLFIFTIILMAITITTYYSARLIITVLIYPTIQQKIYNHIRSNNNNHSIMIISSLRIIIGSALQWLTPIITLCPPLVETLKSSFIPTCLILIVPFFVMILLANPIHLKKHKTNINKFISTLRFTESLWTQFIINTWINISLSLHKYLDQSWLEKRICIRLPTITMVLRQYTNFSFLTLSQHKIFLYVNVSTIFVFCLYICLLI